MIPGTVCYCVSSRGRPYRILSRSQNIYTKKCKGGVNLYVKKYNFLKKVENTHTHTHNFARVAYENLRPFTTTGAAHTQQQSWGCTTAVKSATKGGLPEWTHLRHKRHTLLIRNSPFVGKYKHHHPPEPERWSAPRIVGIVSQTPYQPWANCAPEIRRG